MQRVHMAIASEKGIKSVSYRTRPLPASGELTKDRDLAESHERIEILERENQKLLKALRALAASTKSQTCEQSDVEILSKVMAAFRALAF